MDHLHDFQRTGKGIQPITLLTVKKDGNTHYDVTYETVFRKRPKS